MGTGGTVDLPTPDVTGTIVMSATTGKVGLVNSTTLLTGTDPHADLSVVDFVGWGTANGYETAAATATTNTTSVCRKGYDGLNPQDTYGQSYGNGYDTDNNLNNFYNRTVGSSPMPLPVELSSFSASLIGSSVKLNWVTATEINNYGFDVERTASPSPSNGGEQSNHQWEKIGFVNGNGNSNSPKTYSFIDDKVISGKYSYRLKQIDNDGQFEYSKTIEVDLGAPKKFELSQNYPNPFNPATTIRFNLPEAANVKLTIYNLLGEQIKTLVNEFKEAGVHTINFNAENLNSGLYIYKLEAGSFIQTRKMTLVK